MVEHYNLIGIYTLSERNKYKSLDSANSFGPLGYKENFSKEFPRNSSSVRTIFSLSDYHQFLCIANASNISSLKTGFAYFIAGFENAQGVARRVLDSRSTSVGYQFSTSTLGTSSILYGSSTRGGGCGLAGWSNASGYAIGGASSSNFYDYSPSPVTEPKYGITLPGWTYLSSTDKMTFFTNTISAAPSINLSSPAAFNASLEDDNAGYILGGYYQPSSPIAPSSSNVHKLTYSTESLTLLSNKMVTPIDSFATASDRETKGYTLGGVNSVSGTFFSSVSKLTYSTDTSSNVSTAKSYTPMINVSGVGNYARTAGYFIGGLTGYSGFFGATGFPNGSFAINHRIFTSTIQKINYSTEIVSSLSSAHLLSAPTPNPDWSTYSGQSQVFGNRGFTSAVSSRNYFLAVGGYSEYIYQAPGVTKIFEFGWNEIDIISYSTETNFPQNRNSAYTFMTAASFSTVK